MEHKIIIEENKKTNSFLIWLNGGVLDVFDSEIFSIDQMIAYANLKCKRFLRDGDSISLTTNVKAKEIECPHCNSENVRAYDNQPLCHPSKKDIESGSFRIDTEIFIDVICDKCNHSFQVIGDIVLRPIKK